MPQKNFKVTLTRIVDGKVDDTTADVVIVATGTRKAAAFAIARADEGTYDGLFDPLPEGTDEDTVDFDVRSEPVQTDAALTPEKDTGTASGTAENETARDGSAPAGTAGGMKRAVPDLPGLGTQGIRVDASSGAHVQLTEGDLQAQRQGKPDDTPPPRATSAVELAAPPGCGGVKKALNNPIEGAGRVGTGAVDQGRVLDVNNEPRKDAPDTGAERETAADVQQEQSA